jgi:hypothetical protein
MDGQMEIIQKKKYDSLIWLNLLGTQIRVLFRGPSSYHLRWEYSLIKAGASTFVIWIPSTGHMLYEYLLLGIFLIFKDQRYSDICDYNNLRSESRVIIVSKWSFKVWWSREAYWLRALKPDVWVQMLILPLISCVTWGKFLNHIMSLGFLTI